MKTNITRFSLVLAVLLGVLMPAVPARAASGSISLTASKSTVAAGGTVIIGVYMNGGGAAVNAVQADLSFPASKLQYVGYSATGSAFEIGATSGGGDGSASIARGTLTPIGGSALVGTVTFKALAGSGSATISVAGTSSLVASGEAVPYAAGSIGLNFGAAAAATPATPKAAATPVTPAAPKDTTAPVITAVKPKDITPFSAVVTWTTSEAADSAVEYGVDNTYGLSASAGTAVTAHSVTLNSPFLTPQTLIHYRVKSVDGAGNATVGTDQALQLPGVPVTIVVRGSNGKPQAGVSVTLDNQTGTTGADGRIVLRSSLGNKKITTNYEGVAIQKPITVAKTAKELPPVQLDLANKPLNSWMYTSLGLLVAVLVLLAIDAVLFGSKFFGRLAGLKFKRHPATPALGHAAAASAGVAVHKPAPAMADKSAAAAPLEVTLPVATAPYPVIPDPTPPFTDTKKPAPAGAALDDNIDKTITDMMEVAPRPTPAPATKPLSISHFSGTAAARLKIELQPLEPETTLPAPAPIKIAVIDDAVQAQTAEVAKRLKKKPAAKTTKTTKKAAPKKKTAPPLPH